MTAVSGEAETTSLAAVCGALLDVVGVRADSRVAGTISGLRLVSELAGICCSLWSGKGKKGAETLNGASGYRAPILVRTSSNQLLTTTNEGRTRA